MTRAMTDTVGNIGQPSDRPAVKITINHFARLFYWASLILLLAGAWSLIDPLHRRPGRTLHIYVTLGAFELYMWLLLVLAGWQRSKGLIADASRSGIFAAVLSGLLFVAINEMHMAAPFEGRWISLAAVVLTVLRLLAARKFVGLSLPWPHFAACCAWIAAMALPPAIIRSVIPDSTTDPDKTSQNALGLLACWFAALIAAGHLGLVAWQRRRGWRSGDGPWGRWWTPWVVVAIVGAAAIVQLVSTLWGMYVDWAYWYLSPIGLAVGMVAVALSHARGQYRAATWMLLGSMVVFALAAVQDPAPCELPLSWIDGPARYLVHPIYSNGALISVLLAATAWAAHSPWMIPMALLAPTGLGLTKTLQAALKWRYGKEGAMLLGALMLLCVGALVQWWGTRRKADSDDGFSPDQKAPGTVRD